MRGLSSGLLEVWTRLPNLAVELRSLRRLTLTSVPGRSPNSFEGEPLPLFVKLMKAHSWQGVLACWRHQCTRQC